MPLSEADIGRLAQIEASKRKARIFRNNVGTAWQGIPVRPSSPTNLTVMPGDILLRKSRIVHFGLSEGSGDYIGWKSVIITQDMVGKKFARFSSAEMKTERGSLSQEQLNWMTAIEFAGGIAGVVRNPIEDIRKLFTED